MGRKGNKSLMGSRHTYTTDKGTTYPWRGPVKLYAKSGSGKRLPDIRSEVHVEYLSMNTPEDRKTFAEIMTGVRNKTYTLLGDPVYVTPEGGHQHITVLYEEVYACDPDYRVEEKQSVEVEDPSPSVSRGSKESDTDADAAFLMGMENQVDCEHTGTVVPENVVKMSSLQEPDHKDVDDG